MLLAAGAVLFWLAWKSGGLFGFATGSWRRFEARFRGARQLVEADEINLHTMLMASDLLRRGWQPELIKQRLGRPDFAVLDPQRMRDPLRFYNMMRLQQAERSVRFRRDQEKIETESARASDKIRRWIEAPNRFLADAGAMGDAFAGGD